MKLPEKINPAHCASTDGCRYSLNGVFVQGDLAVATDGRVLLISTATREDDDDARDALIPSRAMFAGFKQARNRKKVTLPRLVINPITEGVADVTVTDASFDKTTVRDIDAKYASFMQAVPEYSGHTLKLGIDIKLLAKLAKSLGTSDLVLNINPSDAIKIENSESEFINSVLIVTSDENQPDSVGFYMPRRVRRDDLPGNEVLRKIAERKSATL